MYARDFKHITTFKHISRGTANYKHILRAGHISRGIFVLFGPFSIFFLGIGSGIVDILDLVGRFLLHLDSSCGRHGHRR